MKMISGRYRSDRLVRHFSPGLDGNCTLCNENVPGSIDHILIECSSLSEVRGQLFVILDDTLSDIPKSLIFTVLNSGNKKDFVQFLLDCSVNSDVISATQLYGVEVLDELFRFTRLWCYQIHKRKLKLQGRWTNT